MTYNYEVAQKSQSAEPEGSTQAAPLRKRQLVRRLTNHHLKEQLETPAGETNADVPVRESPRDFIHRRMRELDALKKRQQGDARVRGCVSIGDMSLHLAEGES